jgi:hypothetical protein
MLRAAVIALAFLTAVAASARVEFGQDIVGSDEGTPFTARCPNFSNLVGLDLYTRDDVDAVQLICASAFGPTELGPIEKVGAPIGGRVAGANHTRLLCAGSTPVVTGAYILAEIRATSGVNNIHLFCGVAGINPQPASEPSAVFDGPAFKHGFLDRFGGEDRRTQHCQKNFVAVGILRRSRLHRALGGPHAAPRQGGQDSCAEDARHRRDRLLRVLRHRRGRGCDPESAASVRRRRRTLDDGFQPALRLVRLTQRRQDSGRR